MTIRKNLGLIMCVAMLMSGCATTSASTTATAATSSTASSAAASTASSVKKVASDGAVKQTTDKTMPTRVIENGTKIKMHFGDTVVDGVLNDSDTAKALIAKLPVTVSVNKYVHDFCGNASALDLPYTDDEVHYGWLNGDIDYAIDAPWFTVLFSDEDVSEQYGYQVNIGAMTSPLSTISSLPSGSYDVTVELDSSAS